MSHQEKNVLIVEDHLIIADLISYVLEGEAGFQIVATVSSVKEGIDHLKHHAIDIVIVDLALPEENGMVLLEWVHQHQPRVQSLVLTMYANSSNVINAVKNGAKGFLPKDTSLSELKQALANLSRNSTYFSQEITNLITGSIAHPQETNDLVIRINNLTQREKEILTLVIQGNNNVEISEKFYISIRTVENHRANILRKTGSRNFLELARTVIENNLLNLR